MTSALANAVRSAAPNTRKSTAIKARSCKDGQECGLRTNHAWSVKFGGPVDPRCYEERCRLGMLAACCLGQLIRDGQKRGTLECKDLGIKDRTHMKCLLATIRIDERM